MENNKNMKAVWRNLEGLTISKDRRQCKALKILTNECLEQNVILGCWNI